MPASGVTSLAEQESVGAVEYTLFYLDLDSHCLEAIGSFDDCKLRGRFFSDKTGRLSYWFLPIDLQ